MSGSNGKGNGIVAALGLAVTLGAAVGWAMYDLKRPNSTLRGLIEVGRRKMEGTALAESGQAEEAAAVAEDVVETNQEDVEVPPPEQMPS